MIQFIVLCAFFVLTRGQSTEISQCIINEAPLPINAYLRGCTTPPCVLPQLTYLQIEVTFRAPRVLRSLRTLAIASVNFGVIVEVPYELGSNAVTCNFFTNTYCPLLPGEVVQYNLNMFIESFFPEHTQATVEFRVVDEENEPLWCIRVPLRIISPLTRNRFNGTIEN